MDYVNKNLESEENSYGIDECGSTLLHIALKNPLCKLKDVRLLLDLENVINTRDGLMLTPLHLVTIHHCSTDVVNLLLDYGAAIEAVDSFGKSALHYALANSSHEKDVIDLLLNHGADIHLKCNEGLSPLHYAVMNESMTVDVIQLLLDYGAAVEAVDQFGQSPLHYALSNFSCKRDVIDLLLNHGADIHLKCIRGFSPLHYAVMNKSRNVDVIQLLLNYGAAVEAVDQFGQSPLHYALSNFSCKRDVIDLLLNHGADIHLKSKDGFSPLHYAAMNKSINIDVIQLLLDRGAEINFLSRSGTSPLHEGLQQSGKGDVIELLLDRGADIHLKCNRSLTPLHYATINNSMTVDVIQLLLHRGAEINVVNQFGDSPLIVALKCVCKGDVIELLLHKGADIHLKCFLGRTSLHYAAMSKRTYKAVISLLNRGATINAVDRRGQSPLYFAVQGHLRNTIKLLLENGALIHPGNGPSPLQKAIELNHNDPGDISFECVKILIKYTFFEGVSIQGLITHIPNEDKLSVFTRECAREFSRMDSEVICVGITLRQFLSSHLGLPFQAHVTKAACDKKDNEEYVFNNVLNVLTNVIYKYPIYHEVISAIMKPYIMEEVLDKQFMYTVSRISSQTVELNIDLVYSIIEFLSCDELLNLVLAFHRNDCCGICTSDFSFTNNKKIKLF